MQLNPDDPMTDGLRDQINALRSGNRGSILEAIREIRADSNVSILPEIFDLMLDQEDEEIIRAASSLLNDLNIQDAVPVICDAIANPEYGPISTLLVAACWQNGLSYVNHADTFVQVAIEGSFEAAIEAFTVLEQAVGGLGQEDRARLSAKISRGLGVCDEQKIILLRELIRMMDTY
jgi:hypothetical protein